MDEVTETGETGEVEPSQGHREEQTQDAEATDPPEPVRPAVTGRALVVSMWRSATVATTLALTYNVGIMLIARAAGANFRITQPDGRVQVIGVAEVVGSTISAVLVGSLMLWLMAYLRGGLLVWVGMATIIGVGFLWVPLVRADQGWSGLTLASMHLVTLACALLFPARNARANGAL